MAKYCPKCGTEVSSSDASCPGCGVAFIQGGHSNGGNYDQSPVAKEPKSRLVAAVFALIFGTLGIHNYYLGYKSKAIAQLLLGTVGILLCGLGPFISLIWAFCEAIQLLSGSINEDGYGKPLTK
jgi:hypothetical protein